MNLRGTVIPIVDLSIRLCIAPSKATERNAIVVTNVKGSTIGLMVDRVSDILTVALADLQPVPLAAGIASSSYAEGILAHDRQMICFLKLEQMFANANPAEWEKAA